MQNLLLGLAYNIYKNSSFLLLQKKWHFISSAGPLFHFIRTRKLFSKGIDFKKPYEKRHFPPVWLVFRHWRITKTSNSKILATQEIHKKCPRFIFQLFICKTKCLQLITSWFKRIVLTSKTYFQQHCAVYYEQFFTVKVLFIWT